MQALQPLSDRNILVVAAAGNENLNMDDLVRLGYNYPPCLVPLPNILCVAATNQMDGRSFYSNYGASSVHVAAPGDYIYSTVGGERGGGQHRRGREGGGGQHSRG